MTEQTSIEVQVCMKQRPNQRVCCRNNGSKKLLQRLEKAIEQAGVDWTLKEAFCMGHCSRGPNVSVPALEKTFHHMDPDRADAFIVHIQQALDEATP